MTIGTISHWLNRQLEVWRKQVAPDGSGGQIYAFVRVGDVMAKVDLPAIAGRGGDDVEADQASARFTHNIFVDPHVDVVRGDELRGSGQRFRVISSIQPSSPLYSRLACEIVQPEPENVL